VRLSRAVVGMIVGGAKAADRLNDSL
jgi:hypothetical protein